MSKEKDIIQLIQNNMPKSKAQINKVFESDAEIVNLFHHKMAFNIDEFSKEDMLRENKPYTLGWNIAIACISDILAVGGEPILFGHSISMGKSWDLDYIDRFSKGIADVLKEYEVSFIGGDLGVADMWKYTGIVIGEVRGRNITRNKVGKNDRIFITGKVGLGNIEAVFCLFSEMKVIGKLMQAFKSQFKVRREEAKIIKKYASSCIDTSDGVFQALNTICDLSEFGYLVDRIPYEESGKFLSKALKLPIELLFLGECGEYELLFTVSEENYSGLIKEIREKQLEIFEIGFIKEANKKLIKNENRIVDLANYNLHARDFSNVKDYLKEAGDYISKNLKSF